jgi:uncharacterized oxidoreductase
MHISRNTVVITGGSSGIGLELARALLARDNTVIVCGRSERKLEDAKAALPELRTVICDVATDEGRTDLLDTVSKSDPPVNVLVNNAGIMLALDFKNPTERTAVQTRDETEIDFVAPMLLSLAFTPLLAAQPEAAIVNLGSILAYVPFAATPVYCAAKAGIHSFTTSLRIQLRGTSIRVFEVLPPAVDTPLMQGFKFSKVAPQRVASEIVDGLAANRSEIRIGQTNMVYLLSRLSPGMTQHFLNRTSAGANHR